MGHDWLMVFGSGDDAPGKSLDEIFHCRRCGAVKHDYRHNGGRRSPNYPTYYRPAGPQPANVEHCPGPRPE